MFNVCNWVSSEISPGLLACDQQCSIPGLSSRGPFRVPTLPAGLDSRGRCQQRNPWKPLSYAAFQWV